MVALRAWWRSFKDVAIFISFITNFILIIILLFVGLLIFQIKGLVGDQLINGLYKSFVGLDESRIITTINVSEPALPVNLNIPLQQNTKVVLTDDVLLSGAKTSFILNGVPVSTTATIVLPKGLVLPVSLDLNVPVNSSIPVNLKVPVNIAVSDTQLHDPITALRGVLRPYVRILDNLPNSFGQAVEVGGKAINGNGPNLNGETNFSQNPWPGFCTDLPTSQPGQPTATKNPICITPTVPATGTATNVPLTPAPGTNNGSTLPPTFAVITNTPGHIDDQGIIPSTPGK